MPPTRRTPYVSVSLHNRVRDDLQTAALALSAQVGRRLTLSDIARADRAVASLHPDELLAALASDATPTAAEETEQ